MLPNDYESRCSKYMELKAAVEDAGYCAQMLESRTDALQVFPSATANESCRFLVARRDDGWFLLAPRPAGLFRLLDVQQVRTACLKLLRRLAVGQCKVEIDTEFESQFQMQRMSPMEWAISEEERQRRKWAEYGWRYIPSRAAHGIWSGFEDRFGFPGDGPPPRPCDLWDLSGLFSLDIARFVELECDLAMKSLHAFQRCVGPDEEIYAVTWQSSTYAFNPHRGIPSAHAEYWAVPILADIDHRFFFAADYRFGLLFLITKKTICIFGEELMQSFDADLPLAFRDPEGRTTMA